MTEMTEKGDIASKAIESLGTGPAAVELYKDLLQPAARETGKNLLIVARAVSLAMAPLEGAVWGFEQIRDWLAVKLTEKLAHTPPEAIHAPKLSIAGPALLHLHFCKDEAELRELYANLLASSMDGTVSASVHPSFVQIIQQLSPDEAKLLRWISENLDSWQICYERYDDARGLIDGTEFVHKTKERLGASAALERPGSIDSYFDNFLRLRIFEKSNYQESEYVEGGANRAGDYGPSIATTNTIEISISTFGNSFIESCVAAKDWWKRKDG